VDPDLDLDDDDDDDDVVGDADDADEETASCNDDEDDDVESILIMLPVGFNCLSLFPSIIFILMQYDHVDDRYLLLTVSVNKADCKECSTKLYRTVEHSCGTSRC
jgi:hypothetical protein